jgi:hypothetical protein
MSGDLQELCIELKHGRVEFAYRNLVVFDDGGECGIDLGKNTCRKVSVTDSRKE